MKYPNYYSVTHNLYNWQIEVNAASNEQAAIVAAYLWDIKRNIEHYTINQITK